MLGDATLVSRRDGRDQESEKHGLVEVVRLHSYCADSERHHRKRLQGDVIVLVLKYALNLQELSMAQQSFVLIEQVGLKDRSEYSGFVLDAEEEKPFCRLRALTRDNEACNPSDLAVRHAL